MGTMLLLLLITSCSCATDICLCLHESPYSITFVLFLFHEDVQSEHFCTFDTGHDHMKAVIKTAHSRAVSRGLPVATVLTRKPVDGSYVNREIRHMEMAQCQISRFSTSSAFRSMNSLRGSTWSPMSVVKISSAATASSMVTCNSLRTSGSIVVSQS